MQKTLLLLVIMRTSLTVPDLNIALLYLLDRTTDANVL